MKNGRKTGRSRNHADDDLDDPEIAAALEGRPITNGPDPFNDFLEDFYSDPEKPLKFLRGFMANEEVYNPAVDVVEHEDRLTIMADLPGVLERDLTVEFVEGGVVLSGRREGATGPRLRRAERPVGEFSKSVPLPKALDVRAAKHDIKDGVLTVTIPRLSESKATRAILKGNVEGDDKGDES